ncbi:MAG TPA: hypothetical protein VK325_12395, partial [Pseudoxanthomonas sp.]|nr:hypothetical protein [Pseudoxanthomonas sp.]
MHYPAPAAAEPPHECVRGLSLWRQLQEDDVGGALDAGLMRFQPCPACPAEVCAGIALRQRELAQAWAARDRYLARNARLARLLSEREARRAPPAAQGTPPLSPAAAAVLA